MWWKTHKANLLCTSLFPSSPLVRLPSFLAEADGEPETFRVLKNRKYTELYDRISSLLREIPDERKSVFFSKPGSCKIHTCVSS